MKAPTKDKVNAFPELEPGDILLYGGGFIGALIQFRTWSDVSHVEVYVGNGLTVSSRAEGPDVYTLRVAGLRRVIRPLASLNFEAGLKWLRKVDHLPYGYADLLRFYLINIPTRGLICSEMADLFFQACGLPLFNTQYPEGAVCPRDYELLSPLLAKQIWSWR